MNSNLDKFTRAYIQTALWSSNGPAFGACPCCEEEKLLTHYPEAEYEQTPMCDAEGCGVTPIESDEPPLDRNYSESDLTPEALAIIMADCQRFQTENAETMTQAIETGEVKCGPDFDETGRAAHDFWLTRNHHGAGFWDGDWPETEGEILTKAAKAFGECNLYVTDDGKIGIE